MTCGWLRFFFFPKVEILFVFLKSFNSYLQDLTAIIESVLIQRPTFNLAISLGSNGKIFHFLYDSGF